MIWLLFLVYLIVWMIWMSGLKESFLADYGKKAICRCTKQTAYQMKKDAEQY